MQASYVIAALDREKELGLKQDKRLADNHKICKWLDYNAGKWRSNQALWASVEASLILHCQQEKLQQKLGNAIGEVLDNPQEMSIEDLLYLHVISQEAHFNNFKGLDETLH